MVIHLLSSPDRWARGAIGAREQRGMNGTKMA